MIRFLLLGAALAVTVLPAAASFVDVTQNSQVTLGKNDDLIFYLSTDYSAGNQPGSYPVAIQMILGGMPLGGPVASIPGTSGTYLPGFLFSATLASQDGKVSIPLTDANASRLGLPSDDLLVVPGSRSGGSYSGAVDLISGVVTLSSQEAAAIFASGGAVIELHNAGANMTFGYPGSSIANDFSASWSSFDGGRSQGADLTRVECVHTPEPATIGLFLIGLAILMPRVIRRCHH